MSEESSNKAILILGSGATAGSGNLSDGKQLPTDNEFFKNSTSDNSRARKLIEEDGAFPALRIMLKKFLDKKDGFKQDKGLYNVWNNIFILRGLGRSGVIRFDPDVIDEYHGLKNHSWPEKREYQKEHYENFFSIEDRFRPYEYALTELAIWDLRVLVKKVYSEYTPDCSVVKQLWDDLKGKLMAVVNLNYDTTFDKSIDGFYYPGIHEPKGRIPLIRPHGSLDWTDIGIFRKAIPGIYWNWKESSEPISLSEMGFRKGNGNFLDFKQPMIVSPAYFKEEIVGNSSSPGFINKNIVRNQWMAVEKVLRKSDHWIFLGTSLASGDDHLVSLLKYHYKGAKHKICFSQYGNDHAVCEKLVNLFPTTHICAHQIKEEEKIDNLKHCENLQKIITDNPGGRLDPLV